MAKSSLGKFEERLALTAYFRHLFGVNDPLDPQAVRRYYGMLNALRKEGYDDEGRSYVYNAINDRVADDISDQELLQYDQNVRHHLDRINKQREEPITFRYFQTLAGLVTEAYLDQLSKDKEAFRENLNSFVRRQNERKGRIKFPEFEPGDLDKIAYWMATGSGKTLLLHLNFYQYLHYFGDEIEHILLVTPNSGLSRQHMESMDKSSVPNCYYTDAPSGSVLTGDEKLVKVIEITKLVEEKTGEGMRVEVSAFEGKNLVFVDEGHKGTGSTAQTWRDRREKLAGDGFTFEYSATFGQAVAGSKAAVEDEYGTAILFDYSYPRFYEDGYGKDYRILNLENDLDPTLTETYLLANLLSYYEQAFLFDRRDETFAGIYNIASPLMVFIGHSVSAGKTRSQLSKNDKQSISDVQELTHFLWRVLREGGEWVGETIDAILEGTAGLTRDDGTDLFADAFGALRSIGKTGDEIYSDLLRQIFHVQEPTGLHLVKLKSDQAAGEIGLRAGATDRFFGVINIGDESNFLSGVEENLPEIAIEESAFEDSLFKQVNRSDSDINVLMGAKKFIEGWSSWRVSTMGLMNIGRSEGAQIIQLFGRGIRLKGKNNTLKRSSALEGTHPEQLPKLETLNIFGIRADYMAQFRDFLSEEGIDVDERVRVDIETKVHEEFLNKGLLVIRPTLDISFTEAERLTLEVEEAAKPTIDLVPRMETLASGDDEDDTPSAGDGVDVARSIPDAVVPLLDWNRIYREIWQFREKRGYSNLGIDRHVLQEVLRRQMYTLKCPSSFLKITSYEDLRRIEEYVLMILRKYVKRFYAGRQRSWEERQLTYRPLEESDNNIISNYVARVKRSSTFLEELEEILEEGTLTEDDEGLPERVHFDRHLYLPLLKEDQKKTVKYTPPGLNDGEWGFVEDLKAYLTSEAGEAFMDGRELFLLRNQSRGHGVGFLVDDQKYFPDFILWVKTPEKQHIGFIDPKGLMMAGSLKASSKVQLHDTIKEYQGSLNESTGREDVELDAFIVSESPFDKLKEQTTYETVGEFAEDGIYFPSEEDHIENILQRMVGESETSVDEEETVMTEEGG